MSSLKDWFKLLRLFLRCIKTICKSSHHPTSSNKKETLSRSTQLVLPWMIQKCQYSTTFFYPLPPSPVSLTKAMILLIVISQAMSICFVFRTHVYATLLHANCAFKVPSMQLLTAYTEVSHLFVLTRYSGATVHGVSVGTHRMCVSQRVSQNTYISRNYFHLSPKVKLYFTEAFLQWLEERVPSSHLLSFLDGL